ncbi:uncharacterized protein LOC134805278 [Cydia splendana]|uniref:uncharacterized protein LOC134805278 n=1 Tax=Cydia splendana TaxID=1100963 RepID=UPI00300CE9D8
MKNAKSCDTPGSNDAKSTQETPQEKEYPYREAVGSLLYLSTRTRPDIAQAVNLVSRNVENPTKQDVVKVKRIFRYLVGTKEKGILFKRNSPLEIINAYSDSDYAGDPKTRRSTSGSVLMIANGPVSWASKRQPIVSLSSTEAEFIAAAECCKEALYLKSFLKEITDIDAKVNLHVDNQSSIQLVKSGSCNKRSKHINVRYHFIHEHFVQGLININYCPTEVQLADIMTKPLGKVKFAGHCKTLMCG